MEESFQTSSLSAQHRIQSISLSPPPFIKSPVTSSLPAAFPFLSFHFPHSYLNLNSPNWLSSEVVSSPNPIKATHVDCNLFLDIYIIQVHKILILNTSNFNLFQRQPSISILYSAATFHLFYICITHPLSKQFYISIHILIHLPSFIFRCWSPLDHSISTCTYSHFLFAWIFCFFYFPLCYS